MQIGKIVFSARLIWLPLLLLAALAALIFWPLRRNTSSYRPEDLASEKPIQAVHGLPGGAHYPASVQAGGQAPNLELASSYYNFGRIAPDRAVTHTFLLRNRGAADLLIHRAYTTCECTAARFSASLIPPGKVALVAVEYDPRTHAASGSTVRRGVIIETNDPLQPQAELWVQAEIR